VLSSILNLQAVQSASAFCLAGKGKSVWFWSVPSWEEEHQSESAGIRSHFGKRRLRHTGRRSRDTSVGEFRMLKGQWFGPYAGTHSGNIIAEFDQVGTDLIGTVTAYPGDPVPPAFTAVIIPVGRKLFEAVLSLQPIDFATGNPVPWAMIAGRHPGLNMSNTNSHND
jgi:hypothetical protein